MCEALDELIKEGEARGEKRLLIKMVKKGKLSIEDGAEEAEMTVEEFKELLENSEEKE